MNNVNVSIHSNNNVIVIGSNNIVNNTILSWSSNDTHILAKPILWCGKQWETWANCHFCTSKDILKKIAVFVPLVLATLAAAIIGIPRFKVYEVTHFYGPTQNGNQRVTVVGSGVLGTKHFDLDSDFNALSIISGHVSVKQGTKNSLVISADDNFLDSLHENRDHQLFLGSKTSLQPVCPISYNLTLNHSFQDLNVHGSAAIHIDSVKAAIFNCKLNGEGTIDIHSGQVDQQNISITGEGVYKASALQSKASKINITGQGEIIVHAINTLSVDIFGEGTCKYAGNPKITRRIFGKGNVVPL